MTRRLAAWALLVAFVISSAGCAIKTSKPVLAKFDSGALTAVQVIAETEKDLSRVGMLTPVQALTIRKSLSPVIDLGESATLALLAWQPGMRTPAALLQLSDALGRLLTNIVTLLPDGDARSKILTVIAFAQQAWAMAIQVIEVGKAPAPEMMPALVGVAGGGV